MESYQWKELISRCNVSGTGAVWGAVSRTQTGWLGGCGWVGAVSALEDDKERLTAQGFSGSSKESVRLTGRTVSGPGFNDKDSRALGRMNSQPQQVSNAKVRAPTRRRGTLPWDATTGLVHSSIFEPLDPRMFWARSGGPRSLQQPADPTSPPGLQK